jgi:serine/threonine-protein kinase
MIGETFGNYEVLAFLGKGGMGQVFLAQHLRIARRAAIKVLAPALTKNPEAVKRFFTEARATSLIHHPGIVEVFDCGIDARGRAYIVMEYLEGETLAAYLKRAGPMSWILACAIGKKIADAVGAAHGSGIVHRDLKPENVILWAGEPRFPSPGTSVKVLDFGIAKLRVMEAPVEGITREGIMLGTPRYTAPEQWGRAAHVDQRADVYSLGCMLHEMICGAPPFASDRMQALMVAHMFQAPPAASQLVPAIPAWLDQLILRMLAKDPKERPASMVEVAGTLQAGDDEPRQPSPPGASPEARPSGSTRSPRRAVVVRGAGLTVAAGGLAGLLLALGSPHGGRSKVRGEPSHAAPPAAAPARIVTASSVAAPLPAPLPLPTPELGRDGVPAREVPRAPSTPVPLAGPPRRRRAPPSPAPRPGKSLPANPPETDGIIEL